MESLSTRPSSTTTRIKTDSTINVRNLNTMYETIVHYNKD